MADERASRSGPRDQRRDRGRSAGTPTDIPARGWKEVLQRAVSALKEDHVSLLAAGVAFKALLALWSFVVLRGTGAAPAVSRVGP